MLQRAGHTLRSLIAELFTSVLRCNGEPPESWKKSFVSVLHKNGDRTSLDNYRRITLLPILYKLFTRV
eukprot:9509805-Karenia_brevis.AAC.1